jgi:putative methylase
VKKLTKSGLGIVLSELKDFKTHNLMLEQYSTPSEIAADMLWNAYMNGDIDGKVIIDAACGPGYLGIGALLLGAKRVFFVDKSEEAILILKENIQFIKNKFDLKYDSSVGEISRIIMKDIADADGDIDEKADVVIQNPPFGTKEKHLDKLFLEKAFSSANIIYSFHKTSTKGFVEAIAKDYGFRISNSWRYDFRIKAVHKFHSKMRYNVDVTVFRLTRTR